MAYNDLVRGLTNIQMSGNRYYTPQPAPSVPSFQQSQQAVRNLQSSGNMFSNRGQTLGAATQAPSAPSGGGGGGGGGGNMPDRGRDPDAWARANGYGGGYQEFLDKGAGGEAQAAADRYRMQMEGTINAGWDSYEKQLDELLNNALPQQQTAQQTLANQTYQTGVNTLGTQKASSERQLQEQQAGSLKDLAGNVKNLFQSGNIYLGTRGAGDSSAADQYSYAVTQQASKARGDLMSQVNQRYNQLKDVYDAETNRLESEKNTRIAEIADWFYGQQSQLRQAKGQAGVGRSQDLASLATNIYNQALAAIQNVQQEQSNRRATLENWAVNNSRNISELTNNMRAVGSSLPQFQGLNGTPQVTSEGNFYMPIGYGTNTTDKDNRGLPRY